jgi:hypothetical protein
MFCAFMALFYARRRARSTATSAVDRAPYRTIVGGIAGYGQSCPVAAAADVLRWVRRTI